MKQGILITGATGFVGRALLSELESRSCHALPVVRQAAGLPQEVVVPDIHALTDWRETLTDCHVVVHLAARVHALHDAAADPLALYRAVNRDATLHLARQSAAAGVKRFVFVSSVKVNGEGGAAPYRETDVPAPEDAYAVSKWEAELGLLQVAKETGMEVVILRPPLVYGPGVKGNFAQLIRWVRKGLPLPFGAVDNRRSLLALENLVDFIALCADHERSPGAANEVFLLSDGEDVSTTELLCKLARAYRVKPRLLPIPVKLMRAAASALGKSAVADRLLGSLAVDGSKARTLLGWRPLVSMDEQLRKMAMHAK